jgi:hypothetical protein
LVCWAITSSSFRGCSCCHTLLYVLNHWMLKTGHLFCTYYS